MKSSKGFTLIELLAVIVILAVIALIATPIILNLIEKARLGAAESSVYAYIVAAEKAVVVHMMSNPNEKVKGPCTAKGTTLTCKKAGAEGDVDLPFTLDVKGEVPSAGSLTVDEKGTITTGTGLTIGSYTVAYSGGKATASATE